IDGTNNGGQRLFTIDSALAGNGGYPSLNAAATTINVSLSGMTLAHATTADANGGAAILDNGENVILNQVEVDHNAATAAGGGAIQVGTPLFGTSDGSLTVSQSGFVGNEATATGAAGGAISVTYANALTVTNTTFDGNRASAGGALYLNTRGAV